MENKKIYKNRLDFYYKSLIVYFIFLICYVLIKGKFFEEKFTVIFQDPIIYICVIFIILFLVLLLVNTIKSKELIIEEDKIIIKNRFGHREILISDIMSVKFSREKRFKTERKTEIRNVRLKLKDRKRYLRIRISEFYDDVKLLKDFKEISKIISRKT